MICRIVTHAAVKAFPHAELWLSCIMKSRYLPGQICKASGKNSHHAFTTLIDPGLFYTPPQNRTHTSGALPSEPTEAVADQSTIRGPYLHSLANQQYHMECQCLDSSADHDWLMLPRNAGIRSCVHSAIPPMPAVAL